ncbi:MAG: M48 family metalloprotease [Bacteroidia bacterium]
MFLKGFKPGVYKLFFCMYLLQACSTSDSASSASESAVEDLKSLWKSGSQKIEQAWDNADPIQINTFRIEDDIRLGKTTDLQIQSTQKIIDAKQYPKLYNELQSITNQFLDHADFDHKLVFLCIVTVIDDDSIVNAFCTPGGYIYIYTGLLRFVESKEELASIIGHEMAHADKRHGTRQLTKQMGIQLILQFLAGDAGPGLLAEITGNLLSLRYSRAYEREADAASVAYLCNAGYPANGGMLFFKHILKKDKAFRMHLLSTHPNPEERIKNINQLASQKSCSNKLKLPPQYHTYLTALLP